MKLRRLVIDRLPGIDERIPIEVEGAGIHIVFGPNGIGKSSICRAVEALYWQDRGPARNTLIHAEFEAGGSLWRARRDGARLTWRRPEQENGGEVPPGLPSSHGRRCFFLRLSDLIDPNQGDDDVAREIHRQISGGFDPQQVAESLFRTAGLRRGQYAGTQFRQADDKVKRRERKQAKLQREEDQVDDLSRELEQAQAAAGRKAAVERAIELAGRCERLARIESRLDNLPKSLARLPDDAAEQVQAHNDRIGELEERIREAQERLNRAASARAASAASGLDTPLDDIEVEILGANARALGEIKRGLEDARREHGACLGKVAEARRTLGGGGPGDDSGRANSDAADTGRHSSDDSGSDSGDIDTGRHSGRHSDADSGSGPGAADTGADTGPHSGDDSHGQLKNDGQQKDRLHPEDRRQRKARFQREDHRRLFEFLRDARNHSIAEKALRERLALLTPSDLPGNRADNMAGDLHGDKLSGPAGGDMAGDKLDDPSGGGKPGDKPGDLPNDKPGDRRGAGIDDLQRRLDRVRQGVEALRQWLRSPETGTRPGMRRPAQSQFWGVLGLVALGAILGAFLHPWLSLVAVVGAVLMAFLLVRHRPVASAARQAARENFEGLGIRAPDGTDLQWEPQSVEKRLRELEGEMARLHATLEATRRDAAIRRQLDHRLEELSEAGGQVEERRRRLMDALGLEELRPDADLVDFARALDEYRRASMDAAGAAGKVAHLEERYGDLLGNLSRKLGRLGVAGREGTVSAATEEERAALATADRESIASTDADYEDADLTAAEQDSIPTAATQKEAMLATAGRDDPTSTNAGREDPASATADRESIASVTARVNHLIERSRSLEKALAEERDAEHDLGQVLEPDLRREREARQKIYADAALENGDNAGLRRQLDLLPHYRELKTKQAALTGMIESDREALARADEDALADWAQRGGQALLAGAALPDFASMQAELEQASERAESLRNKIADIKARVNAAKEGDELQQRIAEREAARETLRERRDQALFDRAGTFLLDRVEREYEKKQMPRILERARQHFDAFTRHHYRLEVARRDGTARLIAIDLSRDADSDGGASLGGAGYGGGASSVGGAERRLEELSDGARAQLLLAARLAYAEELERGRPLPLFLDEALDQSDPERFDAIVRSLGRVANRQQRQIFYLTSDPMDRDRIRHALARDGYQVASEIDLGLILRGVASVSGPDDLAFEPQPEAPPPDDLSAGEYAVALGVPKFSPMNGHAPQHLFCLLADDLRLLHRLLQQGVTRAGQWQTIADTPLAARLGSGSISAQQITHRVQLLETFCTLWRQGRGRPIGRDVLNRSEAVSSRFIDGLSELARELGGDAKQLLDAIDARRDDRVKGFRSISRDKLAAYLRREGHIDDTSPLEREDLRLQALASPAASELESRVARDLLDRWWSWAANRRTSDVD